MLTGRTSSGGEALIACGPAMRGGRGATIWTSSADAFVVTRFSRALLSEAPQGSRTA
jgi:hypothetical protein